MTFQTFQIMNNIKVLVLRKKMTSFREFLNESAVLFSQSKFDNDISKWHIGTAANTYGMFKGCPLEDKEEFWPILKTN